MTTPAVTPTPVTFPSVVLVCKHDKKVTVPGQVVGKMSTLVDMLGDALTQNSDRLLEIPCPKHSHSIVTEIVQYYETNGENLHTYVKEETNLTDTDKNFCKFDNLVKCLATACWFHAEDLTHEESQAQDGMDIDNDRDNNNQPDPEVSEKRRKMMLDHEKQSMILTQKKPEEVVVQDPSEPEISPELAAKRRQLLAEDDEWADEKDTRYRCNIGHKRPLPAVGSLVYVKVAPFENQNDWFPRKRYYDTFIPEKYGHMNPVLYRVVERGTAFENDPTFYEELHKAGFVVAVPVDAQESTSAEHYLGKLGYAWSSKEDATPGKESARMLPECHSARRRIIRMTLCADYFNADAMYNVLIKCMALTTQFYGDKFTPQMFRSMWLLYHDLKGDEHMKKWKWNEAESKLELIEQNCENCEN